MRATCKILCSVKPCGSVAYCKGLCRIHYIRVRRHGSLDCPPPYDRRGNKNPKWKGGKTSDSNGRILLYLPEHPNANGWGYVYRYRVKMEKKIGRILNSDEDVHHKNEDETDDRISNLKLLPRKKHRSLHASKAKRNSLGKFV